MKLRGEVTSGLGKGDQFMSLSGYVEQFEARLGYTPYPGTLNVALDETSTARRSELDESVAIAIDEWNDGDRTYGAAICYPAQLRTADETTYSGAHVLVPVRTEHDSTQLEIVAADRLRAALDIEFGEVIQIHVRQ